MKSIGQLLATLVLTTVPATAQIVEYYHTDALGSVRAVTDSSGAVVERHDYLPYGEEWCGSTVCSSVTPGQPKRFTGKERDAETGLDYFGARYYGSKIGRFTTVDPTMNIKANLFEPQRWNRYAYVTNNPLRFTDPDGRDKIAELFLGESGRHINTFEALSGAEARTQYAQTSGEHPVIAGQLAVAPTLLSGPLGEIVSVGRALRGLLGGGQAKLGDLQPGEVRQIQAVVDEAGRPLEVVGSAARGTRRGVGTDLPIGKGPGTRSDIDYLIPPASREHFGGSVSRLPGIDPKTGGIPGTHNPFMGPAVRFEPNTPPRLHP